MNCRNFLRTAALSSAAFAFLAFSTSANAQKKYDTGASDTEIKIGNIIPYSGPASAYGIIGKMEEAYFKMINDQGGINGRKITFISYDDAYSPAKAVEQTRKLVESDEVLFVFGPLGTPSNTAILKYLNAKKVPQLFVATGATKFGEYKTAPWTMGWQPAYQSEGRIFAQYAITEKPNGKIAVFYQNDDLGKDMLKGLKDGLGEKASMIVAEDSYEVSEPTIDSHIVKMKASGADIFVSISTPKFAAQAIKKVAEIGWKPMFFQSNVGSSVGAVMRPAGIDNAQGVLSLAYAKDAIDPQWKDDEGMKKYLDFLAKYAPFANPAESSAAYGYGQAQTVVQVLKQAGDDLTRANIMKQAASLKDFAPDTLLPGVKINTSATDFYPIEQLRMMRFTGEKWDVFGPPIDSKLGG
ncbi:ABC transporter substrate-binding protein [Tardiphaga sp. 866_E4_N2_1]|uniref:ABC transporter substrate-binding protein n=1 Tax=unclassified Tardiphaga TaxID=2631404 RepID=UPI003F200711